MRTTMLARQRDHVGQRTLCIFRHGEHYHVAQMPRPRQLLPLEESAYEGYEDA
jgi:hypothetical protein